MTTGDRMRVGFIGLGRMGKPMALNLLRAGFAVSVHSRSREPVDELVAAGAVACAGPAEVAAKADVVCTCLPDLAASELVYLGDGGLITNGRPGQVLVEHSTIGPKLARRVGAAAAKRGVGYLDAPVSGGILGAMEGTLTIMAGGEGEHLAQAMPVLEALGSRVHHVGGVGLGCVTKLTNQLLVAVHTLAACEAILMGREAGADAAQLLEVLATSWGTSGMLELWGPSIVSGEFGSRAPMRLVAKDMALVREIAADAGVPLPLGERTAALFDEAMARGLGETDIAALVTLLRPLAQSR